MECFPLPSLPKEQTNKQTNLDQSTELFMAIAIDRGFWAIWLIVISEWHAQVYHFFGDFAAISMQTRVQVSFIPLLLFSRPSSFGGLSVALIR